MQTLNPLPARRRHSPATASIQRRLERWELNHLRQHCAELADKVEDLQRRLDYAEDCAESWRQAHHGLQEHLDNDTDDGRCIGLTMAGELLVVRTGTLQ